MLMAACTSAAAVRWAIASAATMLMAACTSAAAVRWAIAPAADASRQPWGGGSCTKAHNCFTRQGSHGAVALAQRLITASRLLQMGLESAAVPAPCGVVSALVSDLCLSLLPDMGPSLLLCSQPAA